MSWSRIARFVFRGPGRPGTGWASGWPRTVTGVADLVPKVSSAENAYDYTVAHGARGYRVGNVELGKMDQWVDFHHRSWVSPT